ncbi:amidohydrolase [Gloeomargarita lithophora Alchichica-D10]|uniref:Amidohydrolase n=1 Tax=Gloeomargarita lithophora Alchichica-D10 TaxID=1188229 RepID=A0A1J0AGT7_9CYAN|nr:amidohydrolase [Gloeomargarita lithophora]APB35162.1 amidohydrolase [Gloeomargarita lithophora Alchichica-D10]
MTVTTSIAPIRPAIHALQPQLVQWRRGLHQRPELGFREVETAARVAELLRQWGYEPQTGIAHTGVMAVISGAKPGSVLGLRADMDALPIQELNTVPYRSQIAGVMHACGHDGHTAILLGVAHYLAHHREHLRGTVKLIFQPAEEGPGGAKPMIECGVLENPRVEAMFGLHLWNDLPAGAVGVRSGALMAASDFFRCHIQGRGGHGAKPQQTVDALLVAAQAVVALQSLVARQISPLEPAVVTVGELHSGHARNVIADQATFGGTVRYFNPELAGVIPQKLEAIIQGICQAYGATYQLDYEYLYPPLVNHPAMADLVRTVAQAVVEPGLGLMPDCQTLGGEDMAFFLQEVPGCYFFLGSANPLKGLDFPHHHPRFDFDEAVLSLGVELLIRCLEQYGH